MNCIKSLISEKKKPTNKEKHCLCNLHKQHTRDATCDCLTCTSSNKCIVEDNTLGIAKKLIELYPENPWVYIQLGKILKQGLLPQFELPEKAIQQNNKLKSFVEKNHHSLVITSADDMFILAIMMDVKNCEGYFYLSQYYMNDISRKIMLPDGREFDARSLDQEYRRLLNNNDNNSKDVSSVSPVNSTKSSNVNSFVSHGIKINVVPNADSPTKASAPAFLNTKEVASNNVPGALPNDSLNKSTRTPVNSVKPSSKPLQTPQTTPSTPPTQPSPLPASQANPLNQSNTKNPIKTTSQSLNKTLNNTLITQIKDIQLNHDNIWTNYYPLFLQNHAIDYQNHSILFANFSEEIQFAWFPELFAKEKHYKNYHQQLTNHLQGIFTPSLETNNTNHMMEHILKGIHLCENILSDLSTKLPSETKNTTTNTSNTEETNSFDARRLRSRALLQLAWYYFIVNEPKELLLPSTKLLNKSTEKLSPNSPQTKELLSPLEPSYVQDGYEKLIEYLHGLTTKQTTFDIFFCYVLAFYARIMYVNGSYSQWSKEFYYAVSYKYIIELNNLFVVTMTQDNNILQNTPNKDTPKKDMLKKAENPKEKISLQPYEVLIQQELTWYQCLDTSVFTQLFAISQTNPNNKGQDNKYGTNNQSIKFSALSSQQKTVKQEWLQLLTKEPKLSQKYPSLHTLFTELIGLEKVKQCILRLFQRVRLESRRGGQYSKNLTLNFRFVGNPGVGKTHVARLFAQILAELGLRPGVTQEQVENEQEANDKVVKTQLEEEKQQITKVMQELKLQRVKLENDFCVKEVTLCGNLKKSAENLLSASTLVSNAVGSNYQTSYSNTIQLMKSCVDDSIKKHQRAQEKLKQAKQSLDQEDEEYKKQINALNNAKQTTADAINNAKNAQITQRFIETSGGLLATKGPDDFDALVNTLLQANPPGGVIFIDEAHQLMSSSSLKGKDIIQRMIKYSENQRHVLTFILAGYEKEMEVLIDTDPGLSSRFPSDNLFSFEDYHANELTEIFHMFLTHYHPNDTEHFYLEDDNLASVVGRRLARGRGKKGFGNARAIRTWIENMMQRNAERITKLEQERGGTNLSSKEYLLLTKSDVLGIEPDPEQSKPFQTLKNMIGLTKVKENIAFTLKSLKQVWDADLENEPCSPPQLNRVFVGPPGTGKTTIAGIYGTILKESGFLSSGEVILKNPSDFIGSALGESETKTKKIFENCRGKVLVIDEAYSLGQDTPYHKSVLDTIVAEVSPEGGGDLVVILVGYENEINEMIRKANPGLARRFNQRVQFEAYTSQELQKIFTKHAKSQNISISFKVAQAIADVLEMESKIQNFGNAGAAIALFDKLKGIARNRIEKTCDNNTNNLMKRTISIELQDILEYKQEENKENEEIVNGMIPINKELEEYVEELECQMTVERVINGSTPNIRHVVFVGPAGTGKTTSARYLAKLMKKHGLLPTNKLVEVTGESLVAGFVGQTQGLVKAKLDEAIGGVLFIDEAHRLKPSKFGGSFKDEALGVIISATTNPIYQNKLLIVLAGYTQEINDLLNCDQGLKRRFSKHIEFKNIKPTNACLFLRNMLQKAGYSLDEAITNETLELFFHELSLRPGFGNIGDINELFIDLKAISARRLGQEYNELIKNDPNNNAQLKREQYFISWKRNFLLSDLEIAMKQFLERRPYEPQEISPNNVTFVGKEGEQGGEEEEMAQYDTTFEPSKKQNMNINKTIQIKETKKINQNLKDKEEEEEQDKDKNKDKEKDKKQSVKKINKQDKRVVLDILNNLFQQSFKGDIRSQLKQFFAQGSSHPKYQEISKETVKQLQQSSSSLKSQSIENLQEIVSQTMNEWQEIYEKNDKYEANETELDNIQQQLQLIAMNIDEQKNIDEIERQKQEERKRQLEREKLALEAEKRRVEQSMMIICGICGRANTPSSGCGYYGNSPNPIKILKQDMYKYQMYL